MLPICGVSVTNVKLVLQICGGHVKPHPPHIQLFRIICGYAWNFVSYFWNFFCKVMVFCLQWHQLGTEWRLERRNKFWNIIISVGVSHPSWFVLLHHFPGFVQNFKSLEKLCNIEGLLTLKPDSLDLSLAVQLLKKDEDGNYNKTAILACTQIVDCLVENVLRIEEKSAGKCREEEIPYSYQATWRINKHTRKIILPIPSHILTCVYTLCMNTHINYIHYFTHCDIVGKCTQEIISFLPSHIATLCVNAQGKLYHSFLHPWQYLCMNAQGNL